MEPEVYFIETQRFNQWWMLLLLAIVTLIIAAVVVLMLTLKLQTRITTKGIEVRFPPVHNTNRLIPWNEITKAYIREYDPISEYGGWGFRGSSRNKAWNVSGRKGLQLYLADGSKLLIGTKKPGEVTEVLKKLGCHKE